jgi:hypothetical protein
VSARVPVEFQLRAMESPLSVVASAREESRIKGDRRGSAEG